MRKIDETEKHYESEIARAKKASSAYNNFLQEYFELKKRDLFNNFSSLSTDDPCFNEKALEIRRLTALISSIEEDIRSIINSGKMAEVSLSDIERKRHAEASRKSNQSREQEN